MDPLTLFTWGYWGWGAAPEQLVRAADAVETSRGHAPPLFVDVRISRSVRAVGFNGRAFEKTVGPERYRWLDGLGNLAIRHGGAMRLKAPAAAETLLDVAHDCAARRQRVLFFCSCEFPGVEGQDGCHRVMVARLVLEAAARRKVPTRIVEWPGGEPRPEGVEIQLPAAAFEKVRRGAASIPLGERFSLAEMAGLPWGSLVTVRREGAEARLRLLTGPARYKNDGWYLPLYEDVTDRPDEALRQHVAELRERTGFVERQAGL